MVDGPDSAKFETGDSETGVSILQQALSDVYPLNVSEEGTVKLSRAMRRLSFELILSNVVDPMKLADTKDMTIKLTWMEALGIGISVEAIVEDGLLIDYQEVVIEFDGDKDNNILECDFERSSQLEVEDDGVEATAEQKFVWAADLLAKAMAA